jgi:hypothetical protein
LYHASLCSRLRANGSPRGNRGQLRAGIASHADFLEVGHFAGGFVPDGPNEPTESGAERCVSALSLADWSKDLLGRADDELPRSAGHRHVEVPMIHHRGVQDHSHVGL